MTLADKLKQIPMDVKKIRESMSDFQGRPGGETGYGRVAPSGRHWDSKVAECATLLAECYSGKRPMWHLREAMTTSDFPNLFGDVLYRQLLGNYMPYPVTYPSYMRVVDAPDFRVLHMYAIDGGQGLLGEDGKTLLDIKEQAPYPETAFKETPYTVSVKKYGRRYGVSWEMMVNDDLNAFSQRPAMMATGARRSEEYLATTMLMDSNGPHASFFTSGNKNIISSTYGPTNNPKLSFQGLQQAFAQLAAALDADGQPIVVDMYHLVVPPALKVTAENILKSADLRIMQPPGGALPTGADLGTFLYTSNWMSAKLKLSINPYIPYICTDATKGNQSWFMIGDPNDYTTRPAFVFAFLRGYRDPQLFVKDPDARRLGGGSSDPMDGNFANDSIDYKLRHVFGAAQIDPKMAIASNGTET